ncbi:MAG TPA: hypothetical protein VF138_06970 [Caulobacteraceae bacterium]
MRIVTACAAALVFAGPALAAEPPLQVSYPTDAALDCNGLTSEIARVDGILGIADSDAASAQGAGKAAELGTSVAINGALYSGALGAVPGLGLMGNAAGGFMKNRAAAKEAKAKETMRTAETRRAMLMGMYAGKACASAPAATADAAPAAPAS